MDFLDAVRLLLRRWVIVLLGVLLTGVGCGAVIMNVQTIYQASAQYLLILPARDTGVTGAQNPLINQPPGLILAANLIASEVNTKDSVRAMADAGFESSFAVALVPDSGPLLTVQATDTDPAAALAQRDELLRLLDEELADIQTQTIRGIPDTQVITSVATAVNQNAEAVPGAKIKALVIVVAVGAIVTLALAFGLDGPLTRRRTRIRERRRSRVTAEGDDDDSGDDATGTTGTTDGPDELADDVVPRRWRAG